MRILRLLNFVGLGSVAQDKKGRVSARPPDTGLQPMMSWYHTTIFTLAFMMTVIM